MDNTIKKPEEVADPMPRVINDIPGEAGNPPAPKSSGGSSNRSKNRSILKKLEGKKQKMPKALKSNMPIQKLPAKPAKQNVKQLLQKFKKTAPVAPQPRQFNIPMPKQQKVPKLKNSIPAPKSKADAIKGIMKKMKPQGARPRLDFNPYSNIMKPDLKKGKQLLPTPLQPGKFKRPRGKGLV